MRLPSQNRKHSMQTDRQRSKSPPLLPFNMSEKDKTKGKKDFFRNKESQTARKRKCNIETDIDMDYKKHKYDRDSFDDRKREPRRGRHYDDLGNGSRKIHDKKEERSARAGSQLPPSSKQDTARKLLERSKKDLRRKSGDVTLMTDNTVKTNDKTEQIQKQMKSDIEDENNLSESNVKDSEEKNSNEDVGLDRESKEIMEKKISVESKDRSCTPDRRHHRLESPSVKRLKDMDSRSPRNDFDRSSQKIDDHKRSSSRGRSPRNRHRSTSRSRKSHRDDSSDRYQRDRNTSSGRKEEKKDRDRVPSRKRNLSDKSEDGKFKQRKIKGSAEIKISSAKSQTDEKLESDEIISNATVDIDKDNSEKDVYKKDRHVSRTISRSPSRTNLSKSVKESNGRMSNRQSSKSPKGREGKERDDFRGRSRSPRKNRKRLENLKRHKSRDKYKNMDVDKKRSRSPVKYLKENNCNRQDSKSPKGLDRSRSNEKGESRSVLEGNKKTDRKSSASPNKNNRSQSFEKETSKSPYDKSTRMIRNSKSPLSKSSKSLKKRSERKTSRSPDRKDRDSSRSRKRSKGPQQNDRHESVDSCGLKSSAVKTKQSKSPNGSTSNKIGDDDEQRSNYKKTKIDKQEIVPLVQQDISKFDKFKSDDIKITVQMNNSNDASKTREIVLESKRSETKTGNKKEDKKQKSKIEDDGIMDEWDAVNYRDKSGKHGDKEFDKTGSKNRKKEKYVKDEKDKKSDGKNLGKSTGATSKKNDKHKDKIAHSLQSSNKDNKTDSKDDKNSDNSDEIISPKLKSCVASVVITNSKEKQTIVGKANIIEAISENRLEKRNKKDSTEKYRKAEKNPELTEMKKNSKKIEKNERTEKEIGRKKKNRSAEKEKLLDLQKDRDALLKEIEMLNEFGSQNEEFKNDDDEEHTCMDNKQKSFPAEGEIIDNESLASEGEIIIENENLPSEGEIIRNESLPSGEIIRNDRNRNYLNNDNITEDFYNETISKGDMDQLSSNDSTNVFKPQKHKQEKENIIQNTCKTVKENVILSKCEEGEELGGDNMCMDIAMETVCATSSNNLPNIQQNDDKDELVLEVDKQIYDDVTEQDRTKEIVELDKNSMAGNADEMCDTDYSEMETVKSLSMVSIQGNTEQTEDVTNTNKENNCLKTTLQNYNNLEENELMIFHNNSSENVPHNMDSSTKGDKHLITNDLESSNADGKKQVDNENDALVFNQDKNKNNDDDIEEGEITSNSDDELNDEDYKKGGNVVSKKVNDIWNETCTKSSKVGNISSSHDRKRSDLLRDRDDKLSRDKNRIDKRQRRHSSESKTKISNRSEKSVSCGNRHNEEKDSKERYKTAQTKHSKDREKDRENYKKYNREDKSKHEQMDKNKIQRENSRDDKKRRELENKHEYSKETDRKGIKSKHGDVSKNRTHSESEHSDRKGTKSKHGDVSKSRTHSDVENSDRKSTKSKHDDVSKNRTHSEIENSDRKSTKSKHNDVSKNRTHSEIENCDRKSTKSKHGDVSKNRTHSEIENCDEKEAKSTHDDVSKNRTHSEIENIKQKVQVRLDEKASTDSNEKEDEKHVFKKKDKDTNKKSKHTSHKHDRNKSNPIQDDNSEIIADEFDKVCDEKISKDSITAGMSLDGDTSVDVGGNENNEEHASVTSKSSNRQASRKDSTFKWRERHLSNETNSELSLTFDRSESLVDHSKSNPKCRDKFKRKDESVVCSSYQQSSSETGHSQSDSVSTKDRSKKHRNRQESKKCENKHDSVDKPKIRDSQIQEHDTIQQWDSDVDKSDLYQSKSSDTKPEMGFISKNKSVRNIKDDDQENVLVSNHRSRTSDSDKKEPKTEKWREDQIGREKGHEKIQTFVNKGQEERVTSCKSGNILSSQSDNLSSQSDTISSPRSDNGDLLDNSDSDLDVMNDDNDKDEVQYEDNYNEWEYSSARVRGFLKCSESDKSDVNYDFSENLQGADEEHTLRFKSKETCKSEMLKKKNSKSEVEYTSTYNASSESERSDEDKDPSYDNNALYSEGPVMVKQERNNEDMSVEKNIIASEFEIQAKNDHETDKIIGNQKYSESSVHSESEDYYGHNENEHLPVFKPKVNISDNLVSDQSKRNITEPVISQDVEYGGGMTETNYPNIDQVRTEPSDAVGTHDHQSIEKYPQGLKTGYRIPKKKPSENKDWKEPSNKDKWGNSLDKYFQGQDATYGRHRYAGDSFEGMSGDTKGKTSLKHGIKDFDSRNIQKCDEKGDRRKYDKQKDKIYSEKHRTLSQGDEQCSPSKEFSIAGSDRGSHTHSDKDLKKENVEILGKKSKSCHDESSSRRRRKKSHASESQE